jgi:4-amino-4-deoxy-L-arabinose transferase-like glycosyltransferase
MNTSLKKTHSIWDQWFLVILASWLNIYNLWTQGYGNSYYAAAIKNMLTSFQAFFFVSYDSVGFISVDKAPLSLWLDTLFAKLFGFNGFIILLPHALAGVLVTYLTYWIARRVFGRVPAFLAALTITLSPVNVAVYRNNTPDALLLVFILLAILFLLRYLENFRWLDLLLSAVMVGLGFNTKMLQAYLVLPALLGILLLFSKGGWKKRVLNLLGYLSVVLLVSFVWITIVDLTPATLRPFVGGSENNSAWNLAFAYNGTQRLLGESGVGGQNGFNTGEKGLQRLFLGEMGTQTGWFLASVILFSMWIMVRLLPKLWQMVRGRVATFEKRELFNLFNVGFLLVGYLFFSYAGFFHSYYLNLFALPIAFLLGGVFEEIRLNPTNKWLPWLLLASLPVQVFLILQAQYAQILIPIILVVSIGGIVSYLLKPLQWRWLGVGLVLFSLFLTPLVWSGYTTLLGNTASPIIFGGPQVRSSTDRQFPPSAANPPTQAGNFPPLMSPGNGQFPPNGGMGGGMFGASQINAEMLAYLKANSNGEKYFLAVTSQNEASAYILSEGIGNIMTLGGFSGRDQVLTLAEFQQKIANGEVRYIYLGGDRQMGAGDGSNNRAGNGNPNGSAKDGGGGMFNANSEITDWVKANCQQISEFPGLYALSVP